jgi:hypothetical protein
MTRAQKLITFILIEHIVLMLYFVLSTMVQHEPKLVDIMSARHSALEQHIFQGLKYADNSYLDHYREEVEEMHFEIQVTTSFCLLRSVWYVITICCPLIGRIGRAAVSSMSEQGHLVTQHGDARACPKKGVMGRTGRRRRSRSTRHCGISISTMTPAQSLKNTASTRATGKHEGAGQRAGRGRTPGPGRWVGCEQEHCRTR